MQAGEPVPREAFIVLYERSERRTYEAVVSLTDEEVVSWRHIEGVQSPITFEEFMACEAAVQADSELAGGDAQARRRGLLAGDDRPVGGRLHRRGGRRDGTRRILRPLTWVRSEPGEHGYARPIEGLVVEFDLDAMAVVAVHDYGVVPLPPKRGNYDQRADGRPGQRPELPGGARPTSSRSRSRSPKGPSFTVEGHRVRWQKWQLRIGFTPREGLVLHDIGYEDRGTLRPIIYRASLAEMFVPYGDPAPTHRFKNVFDMGEYGVGWLANPLAARLRLPRRDPATSTASSTTRTASRW